jgi:iron complex outermembrane receptor protein
MQMKYGRTMLFATTALGLGFAPPVMAQEESDIIVTARRIEERLQDVPVSITVFNQEQLDDRAVTNASDLATYTPSLSASSNFGPQNASFAIRGFVQDNFTAPSVGVYFADVITPRGASSVQAGDGAGPGSFFDLQNVQVLKGPQGTLFGRNTTGGAILLVPERPGYEYGGYIQGTVGDFNRQGVQAVLNVPLGDQARFRIGVDHMQRDGYLNNIGAFGPDDLNSVDYTAARASFVLDMAPNLENYSILSYAVSESSSHTQRPTICNPDAEIAGSSGTMPTGLYSCAQIDRLNASGDFYAVENIISDPGNEFQQWQFINTTTWDISDTLTLRNIISYAELRNFSRSSVFGNYWIVDSSIVGPSGINTVRPGFDGEPISPAQITNAPDTPLNYQNTITEEIQLQGSSFDNRLTWQTGLYYESSQPVNGFVGTMGQNNGRCADIGYNPELNEPDSSECVLPYNFLSGLSRALRTTEFVDRAVYGQATFDITDQLSATLGLRYTDDHSEAVAQNYGYVYFEDEQFQPGIISPRCSDPGPTVADGCLVFAEQDSQATTGVFDLEYSPTDDLMTYVKYSRGYRQGLVNPRGVPPYNEFDQEQVDTYELGLKTSWDSVLPGYLNVAAHYSDFTDQQLLVSFLDDQGRTNASACSCGTSEIYGVELDAGATLFDGFRVSGALAYLHTELVAFEDPPLPEGYVEFVPGNTVGYPLNQAPEWKGSITAAYTLPIEESLGEITLAATYTYTDDYYTKSTEFALIDGFSIVNLNLNWDHIGGSPVDLGIFATNVLDEEYYTFATDLYDSALGFVSNVQGEPRMVGARLRYSFGGEAN